MVVWFLQGAHYSQNTVQDRTIFENWRRLLQKIATSPKYLLYVIHDVMYDHVIHRLFRKLVHEIYKEMIIKLKRL